MGLCMTAARQHDKVTSTFADALFYKRERTKLKSINHTEIDKSMLLVLKRASAALNTFLCDKEEIECFK